MREAFASSESFRTTEINQIPIHICATDKYKTNSIAFYIRQPLSKEHYSKVALIPQILLRGTQTYPTAGQFRQALDDLYGASLYTDIMKRGEEQVVVFRLQVANEKFLTDQTPLLEKGIQLLSDVLLHPIVENGAFSQKFVDIERDLLLRKIAQIKDDKMRYANKRCVEEMFKDERFGLFSYGSEEQLKELTATDLYAYYQQMLQAHPVEMFVIGDVSEQHVTDTITKHLTLPREEPIQIPPTEVEKNVGQENEVIEKTKISQGKLNIGCRTGTVYSDDDYVALLVCNGIFGGFSHSKLFRNVREKESLAYYVSSSIESHKGFMMILSGIEFKNYTKTVTIIKEQLQLMKDGHITAEELDQTKAVLVNQIREANDQPFQLMERYMHGVIGGVQRNAEELVQEIRSMTKEQIQAVAQKIEVDTVYFLTSEKAGEE